MKIIKITHPTHQLVLNDREIGAIKRLIGKSTGSYFKECELNAGQRDLLTKLYKKIDDEVKND